MQIPTNSKQDAELDTEPHTPTMYVYACFAATKHMLIWCVAMQSACTGCACCLWLLEHRLVATCVHGEDTPAHVHINPLQRCCMLCTSRRHVAYRMIPLNVLL